MQLKSNTLFNFIRNENPRFAQSTSDLNNYHFQFKTNQQGKCYILTELPVNEQSTLKFSVPKTYLLTAHHISIYELQKHNLATLSQYHYTAYFTDSDNKQHQLHVYFNNNDQSILAVWSATKKNIELSVEEADIATEFALTYSRDLLKKLRNQFNSQVTLLINDYRHHEKTLTALSTNMSINEAAYLTTIKQAVAILQLLDAYHDNNHYKHIRLLFEKIARLSESPAVAIVVDNENSEPAGELAKPLSVKLPTTKLIKSNLDFQQLLRKLTSINNILSKPHLSQVTQAALRVDQHKKINELLLLLEDETCQLSIKNLQIINSWYFENQERMEKILLKLLMAKDRIGVDIFKEIKIIIPRSWLTLALKTANTLMLEFVLTHGELSHSTYLINDELTPVQYCFKNGEKYSDCLSLLIKHKASLFVPAEDGLPIAYHIIDDQLHPLRLALFENKEIIFLNTKFYNILIYQLEIYQSNSSDKSLKIKISQSIADYKSHIIALNASGKNYYQNYTSTLQQIYTQKMVSPDEALILNDPEVQAKLIACRAIIAQYKKSLSCLALHRSNFKTLDIYDNAIKLKELFGGVWDKNAYMTHFDEQIELCRASMDLGDVLEELKKFSQGYSKNKAKYVRGLYEKEKELRARIEEINAKYDFEMSKDKSSDLNAGQALLNISNNLASLKSSLTELHKRFSLFDASFANDSADLDESVSSDDDNTCLTITAASRKLG